MINKEPLNLSFNHAHNSGYYRKMSRQFIMNNSLVWIVRVIGSVMTLIIGIIIQLLLWKTPEVSYMEAILQFKLLWLIYIFGGLLVSEHILCLLNKRL